MFVSFLVKIAPVYAVGLGLFVDELPFILIKGKTHEDNYSKKSLYGLFVLIALVFLTKKYVFIF